MKLARVVRLVRHRVMDDETRVGVHRRLHVVRRRLRSLAEAHRASVGLSLHQRVAPFGLERSRQAIEFGAARLERLKRRSRRVRRLVGLAGVALVQAGKIVGDPPVESKRHGDRTYQIARHPIAL